MTYFEDILEPYIYNLVYDYDDFLEALNGSDEKKNEFLNRTAKIITELFLIFPNANFDQSEKIEEIVNSYLKMRNEISSNNI
jgi:hypothetical protein